MLFTNAEIVSDSICQARIGGDGGTLVKTPYGFSGISRNETTKYIVSTDQSNIRLRLSDDLPDNTVYLILSAMYKDAKNQTHYGQIEATCEFEYILIKLDSYTVQYHKADLIITRGITEGIFRVTRQDSIEYYIVHDGAVHVAATDQDFSDILDKLDIKLPRQWKPVTPNKPSEERKSSRWPLPLAPDKNSPPVFSSKSFSTTYPHTSRT